MPNKINTGYSVGERDTRPWGSWEVLAIGDGFIIKEIAVNPGARLSLQSHQHRSEHWTILEGSADVTLGQDVVCLVQHGTIFIPAKTKHRIFNAGASELKFLEIQTGQILDETDIDRFDDDYDRV